MYLDSQRVFFKIEKKKKTTVICFISATKEKHAWVMTCIVNLPGFTELHSESFFDCNRLTVAFGELKIILPYIFLQTSYEQRSAHGV